MPLVTNFGDAEIIGICLTIGLGMATFIWSAIRPDPAMPEIILSDDAE